MTMATTLFFATVMAASSVQLGPPAVITASKIASNNWLSCVLENAARYSKLDEPAETIANASLTRCETLKPLYRSSLDGLQIIDGPSVTDDSKDKIVENLEQTARSYAVSTVLERRLNRPAGAKH